MTTPAEVLPQTEEASPEGDLSASIGYAGIALQATDTGRVLLLQRSLADGEDINKGLWEFPGGQLDDGEDPLVGARREFGEEVGVDVPSEAHEGPSWDLPPDAPKYRLFRMTVPTEKVIDLNSNEIQNPDDPRGLDPEAVAWWDPAHIEGEAIRPEVLDAMKTVNFGQVEDTVPDNEVAASGDAIEEVVSPEGDVEQEASPEVKAVDLLEQVEAALRGEHDPAQVVELVTNARKILTGDDEDIEVMEADALTASAAPVQPPDEWFEPFDLGGPTPITVTADGRVFGHLTTWDSCHRGDSSGKCLKPPSDPNAPFFQLGQVQVASGNMVDVGVITVGGGHWTKNGLMTTIEHHDDVTAAAATVRVHEDEYGVGLYGAVTPDATPQMVAALRRSPLSGAWRKEKGAWRLKGAHAVNDPGYPIPRGLVASAAGDTFLTMGRPEPKEAEPFVQDLRSVANRLARSAGLDTESLVASARAQMADLDCECDDETMVASIIGDTDLPVAGYGLEWDGGAAADRIFAWADGDVDKISKGFLWRNTAEPADQKSGYDLPFADIIDGELAIVPRGVQATAGGHGVGQLNASPQDKNAIKRKIGVLYGKIQARHPDAPANPFDNDKEA